MKLFTTNPYASSSDQAVKDYCLETDNRIQALQAHIDRTNPNWFILNEEYTPGQPAFSTLELLKNGIVNIVLFENNEDAKVGCYICPNLLRLHIGLIQEYGPDTYYWFYNKEFDRAKSYVTLSEDKKSLVKEWISQHIGGISQGDLYNLTIRIWDMSAATTYNRVLTNGTTYLTNIYLTSENEASHETLFLKDNSGSIVPNENSENAQLPIIAREGTVIFCNALEENEPQNKDSSIRAKQSSYIILPMSGAGNIYIPSSYAVNADNTTTWTWKLIKKGTDTYGTNIPFHLPGPPMRLILPQHSADNILNMYEVQYNIPSSTLLAYTGGSEMKPQIANKDNTIWDGFEKNTLCSKFITGDYEEFICDETIEYGDTNFANYKIPYYTITVENMVSPSSVKPDFPVYLTIV